MRNLKKLSHIIIIVEKIVPGEDICAFCTSVKENHPQMRFTYHSYDNQFQDDICNLFNKIDSPGEELFVITDSQEIIDFTNNIGIACAGLYTEINNNTGLSGVLYCIEDIEFIDFKRVERMWQRARGIPWVILETDRLIVREQTLEDIDRLYEIYAHPDIYRYTENLYSDRDEERKYLEDYIEHQYKYYEFGVWALVEKKSGELIGRAGLSVREGCDDPELGFVMGKDYQNKGYAYEACSAITEYAFGELCADRIVAYAKRQNKASINLLKKLGFVEHIGSETNMFFLTKQ